MNLLIVTRKVDRTDERMSFFYEWILSFARNVDNLYVICLERGDTSGLPKNVTIRSMGKEKGYGKIRKYFMYRKWLKLFLPEVSGVFAHMNPIYAVVAGPLVKKYGKKMYLWYLHGTVDKTLRQSEKWVSGYISAVLGGFPMKTKKPIHFTGHGIDIEKFKNKKNKSQSDIFRILSVGRISPAKRLVDLIEVINFLVNKKQLLSVKCFIIGAPGLQSQQVYLEKLHELVSKYGLENFIEFLGPKPYKELPHYYEESDLFINLSESGGLDKAPLEAMSFGVPVLVSDEVFRLVLEKVKGPELMYLSRDISDLAGKIVAIKNLSAEDTNNLSIRLRGIIVYNHSLDNTIKKIINIYK